MADWRRVLSCGIGLLAWNGADASLMAQGNGRVVLTVDSTPRGAIELQVDSLPRASTASLVAFGSLGAATGLFGGATLGYFAGGGGDICGDDPCGLASGVVGALIGESIGLSTGVHLGNGRRGNYAFNSLVSLGLALVGLRAMVAIDPDRGGLLALAATPVIQLALSIAIERGTSRSRSARR